MSIRAKGVIVQNVGEGIVVVRHGRYGALFPKPRNDNGACLHRIHLLAGVSKKRNMQNRSIKKDET